MHKPISLRKSDLGFSLVELLVATAITLISLLIIVQVFSVYDGWKRTTTGTAQSQENGLLGAFSIERDLRHAGFGMIGLACPTITAYHANAPFARPLSVLPVTIAQGPPAAAGTDSINVLYSSSPFGNIAARVQADLADSGAPLIVDNGIGFNQGDMVLISQPPADCFILQLSQDATGAGTSWNLPHGLMPWNPQANVQFPVGAYTGGVGGAQVLNLGQLVDRRYFVQNNVLRMAERSMVTGNDDPPFDLIPGVIGLRARYGRDTNADGVLDTFDNDTAALTAAGANTLVAVQISLIVRSGNWERTEVSPAAIEYWPGEALAIGADDRHYRYRVFQTVVPLKNTIWNN
jgi:type IV pilus assembly protein PilW